MLIFNGNTKGKMAQWIYWSCCNFTCRFFSLSLSSCAVHFTIFHFALSFWPIFMQQFMAICGSPGQKKSLFVDAARCIRCKHFTVELADLKVNSALHIECTNIKTGFSPLVLAYSSRLQLYTFLAFGINVSLSEPWPDVDGLPYTGIGSREESPMFVTLWFWWIFNIDAFTNDKNRELSICIVAVAVAGWKSEFLSKNVSFILFT